MQCDDLIRRAYVRVDGKPLCVFMHRRRRKKTNKARSALGMARPDQKISIYARACVCMLCVSWTRVYILNLNGKIMGNIVWSEDFAFFFFEGSSLSDVRGRTRVCIYNSGSAKGGWSESSLQSFFVDSTFFRTQFFQKDFWNVL